VTDSEASKPLQDPNQPLSSYEEIRGSAPSEARSAWVSADNEESSLRAFYEDLEGSDVYSEQEKARQA
jgi:hypothetical protein